jgi:hypothetical protein
MKNTLVAPPLSIRDKLAELRTQLVDLAFVLERRGQAEAADVAITTSARLNELCDELMETESSRADE